LFLALTLSFLFIFISCLNNHTRSYCPVATGSPKPCSIRKYYCPAGSTNRALVSSGYQSIKAALGVNTGETEYADAQTPCRVGYKCIDGREVACPAGSYQDAPTQSSCKSCVAGHYCSLGASSLTVCGNVNNYCPANSGSVKTASAGYYTFCGASEPSFGSENVNCPENKRDNQAPVGDATKYIAVNGKRYALVRKKECSATASIPENTAGHTVSGTPVEFTSYFGNSIQYSFTTGTDAATLACRHYFWGGDGNNPPAKMDLNAFQTSGTFKLLPGVKLDRENGVCFELAMNIIGTDAVTSNTGVENCQLQLSIGDLNDAPIWITKSYQVDVTEKKANEPDTRKILSDNTLAVNDPDFDQVTFSVSGTPQGCTSCDWFEVSGCDGQLRLKSGANIRFSPGLGPITVLVAASDNSGAQAVDGVPPTATTGSITVNVINRPEPPTINAPFTFSADENVQGCNVAAPPTECFLGTVQASDPDGSTLTYSTENEKFSVHAQSGKVFSRLPFDFETLPNNAILALVVKVTDQVDNFVVYGTYSVQVVDKNDAPSITCTSTEILQVPENAAINTPVNGGAAVTNILDQDCSGGVCALTDVSYSASGDDTTVFDLQAPTASIFLVKSALNFEALKFQYSISILATDKGVNLGGVAPFATASCDVTITVTDINEPPVVADQSRSILETAPIGTELPVLVASDPDNEIRFSSVPRQALSWRIRSDDSQEAGTFVFYDTSVGIMSSTRTLDADTVNGIPPKVTYTIRIGVKDGALESEADITITVTEVNEAPTLVASAMTLPENSVASGVINNNVLASTDPDDTDTATYSIVSCNDALNSANVCLFSIGGAGNNKIIINSAAAPNFDFDYEEKKTLILSVKVTDKGNLFNVQTISVTLTDNNDAPTLVASDSQVSVDIEPTVLSEVARLTGTDQDLLDSSNSEILTISITSGNGDNAFEIVPPLAGGTQQSELQRTWILRVKNPRASGLSTPGNSWNLLFTITDTSSSTSTTNMNIIVQSGNKRPVVIVPTPTFSINENANIGSVIALVNSLFSDAPENDPITMVINTVKPIDNTNLPLQPGQCFDKCGGASTGSGTGFNVPDPPVSLTSLTLTDSLDYEQYTSLVVSLEGKDDPPSNNPARNFLGKTVEGSFTITITDINENPVFTNEPATFFLSESSANNDVVAEVEAKDPDLNTVLTFLLVSNHAVETYPFAVSNKGGSDATAAGNNVAVIKVAHSALLNYEGPKNTYFFQLKASDGILSVQTDIRINITDAREPPSLQDGAITVNENDNSWHKCLVFQDEDADRNTGNIFELIDVVGGTLNDFLEVRSPGCVYARGANGFNYEDRDSYAVLVKVKDNQLGDSNAAFQDVATLTIAVNDVLDTTVATISPSTLPTTGGTITLNGTDIGPTAKKLAAMATDVDRNNAKTMQLTFVNGASETIVTPYVTTNCQVISPSKTIACDVPEGVGSQFTWTLKMGPAASVTKEQTLEFMNGFAYESPVISSVTAPSVLSTYGGTSFTINGAHFGPTSVPTDAIVIKYKRGIVIDDPGGYVATGCSVSVAHTEITCSSVPGIGKELTFWISSLMGSKSNILSDAGNQAKYDQPIITSIVTRRLNPNNEGATITSNNLRTEGGDVVIISGNNFGPASSSHYTFLNEEMSRVSYGGQNGQGYIPSNCKVTSQTTLECTTSSGTGANHRWLVTRGDQQVHSVSSFNTSYGAPVITDVSGTSLQSFSTKGSAIIQISGSNLGNFIINPLSGSSNIDIQYGKLSKNQTLWYTCSNVKIVVFSKSISCSLAEGTGGDLSLRVRIDGQDSNILNNVLSYAAPVVIGFSGQGAYQGDTSGQQKVYIDGSNFGRTGLATSKINEVTYGKKSTPESDWYKATGCIVTLSHTRIECTTTIGEGADLQWSVVIDGQKSTTPTTNYAPPRVTAVKTITGVAVTSASADGGELVYLEGTNFGRSVEKVTFGPQGLQYVATDCTVVTLSTKIKCTTPPGIGASLKFLVTVGGQVSPLSSATFSYAAPVVENVSSVQINTEGQAIDFTGNNYGLKLRALSTQLNMGASVVLFSTASEKLTNGKDKATFLIPPLIDMARTFIGIDNTISLKLGQITATSVNKIQLSYAPPVINKIFMYEGVNAALRVVVEGSNFCGTIECGVIEVKDSDQNDIFVQNYLHWNHQRIEFEINAAKGKLRVSVGSNDYGYQQSLYKSFEHKSPIIDNGNAISSTQHPTAGGTFVTIEGRYFRLLNIEVWIQSLEAGMAAVQANIISIQQKLSKGPHFYSIIARIPPGQGLNNKLFVRLPSMNGLLDPSDSEHAPLNYKPPTSLKMSSHSFATTGAFVTLTGVDLGLCAVVIVDNVEYRPNGAGTCTTVTNHNSVRLALPDGDGPGHLLSVSIGGQTVSPTTGWASTSEQCNNGMGLNNKFGWFDYKIPVVRSIFPNTAETSGSQILTITGSNFGRMNNNKVTVQLYNRNEKTECTCDIALKSYCLGGFSCTASQCCSENPGCGCFATGCSCCSRSSTCEVISNTHSSIKCKLQPGQGEHLEVNVVVNSQSSSDKDVTFSYVPPVINSLHVLDDQASNIQIVGNTIYSPTTGGDLIRINGTSFGNRDAFIELLGDSSAKGTMSRKIGPIPVLQHTHTSLIFRVPPGFGKNRQVLLNVGGLTNIYQKYLINYMKPHLQRVVQPSDCTAVIRTTACGSPTIGGFDLILMGKNFQAGFNLKVGKNVCCDTCPTKEDTVVKCPCCIKKLTHTKIEVKAPPGVGVNIPIVIQYPDYDEWKLTTAMSYDAPHINYINPQIGNANGEEILIAGINFGDASGGDVSAIQFGKLNCNGTKWAGLSSLDEKLKCFLPMDTVGPKSVQISVAGQTTKYDASEWSSSSGRRLYSARCPINFFGDEGEFCYECPFALDKGGVTIVDSRGDKQHLASCVGGNVNPVAKSGFYLHKVYKQCGTTNIRCTNTTDCSDDLECSYDNVPGSEYCNATMKENRNYCTYVLPCDPLEACDSSNQCSIVPEGVRDPNTNRELDPHGYSNVTLGGKFVPRCGACASGYFRVGGLCELCPKNIKMIAVFFFCAIIAVSICGYIMNRYKVNLAILAIGVDYAQIMSMFLKSQIRWPAALRTLFRILSSFNFDLDIASPECLAAGFYRYDIKWYCIMALPVSMAIFFLVSHLVIVCKKRFVEGRTEKLNKHAHAMVSMNLVMMYFLYLYVTRSALDVFNCTPLDPPDLVHPDYTYMAAVGGERCYEEGGLQMKLLPYAVMGIIIYTIGYPVTLACIFRKNRKRIQRDQYLRAGGEGSFRSKSDTFNIFNIRKRYSHLYYQFKPRSYYWTVVIIARKFAIAAINLMLRQDVEYMLAASLLVMFIAFSVQVHINPYMGPAEFKQVRKKWGDRTRNVSGDFSPYNSKNQSSKNSLKDSPGWSSDQSLMANNKKKKYPNENARMSALNRGSRLGSSSLKSMASITKKWSVHLVNYNTVEAILLASSVLVMLSGIMFSSGRFANYKNEEELNSITWATIFIIVSSLAYYMIVLLLEISAQACPGFCKKRYVDFRGIIGVTHIFC
jgi:hypothetical protein